MPVFRKAGSPSWQNRKVCSTTHFHNCRRAARSVSCPRIRPCSHCGKYSRSDITCMISGNSNEHPSGIGDLMLELTLIHLYPDLMNLYGDRGNIVALTRRCEWRGIRLTTLPVSLGDPFDPDRADLVFIGGGQDYEQSILQEDVLTKKRDAIIRAVEADTVFLAICGGYQLMGHYYRTHDGKRIECLGAIDLHTIGGTKRLIGNLVFDCPSLPEGGNRVVGFENHSGKTYLGTSVD